MTFLKSLLSHFPKQIPLILLLATPVTATPTQETLLSQTELPNSTADLNLDPEIIESSPVFQEWQKDVPNVLEEIRNDPSFRPVVRFGFTFDEEDGVLIGVKDALIGETGLTANAEYRTTFDGDRTAWGGNLEYYVLPLGNYFNVAPLVGYRNIEINDFTSDGLEVGASLKLALSRDGASDITLTQRFVSPGSSDEVGITSLSVAYAVTSDLRLATEILWQNAPVDKESRLGLILEWMPY